MEMICSSKLISILYMFWFWLFMLITPSCQLNPDVIKCTCYENIYSITADHHSITADHFIVNCGFCKVEQCYIWGSKKYRYRSSICCAGIHHGSIPQTGGKMEVFTHTDGVPGFLSTVQNGVRSRNFPYSKSQYFTLEAHQNTSTSISTTPKPTTTHATTTTANVPITSSAPQTIKTKPTLPPLPTTLPLTVPTSTTTVPLTSKSTVPLTTPTTRSTVQKQPTATTTTTTFPLTASTTAPPTTSTTTAPPTTSTTTAPPTTRTTTVPPTTSTTTVPPTTSTTTVPPTTSTTTVPPTTSRTTVPPSTTSTSRTTTVTPLTTALFKLEKLEKSEITTTDHIKAHQPITADTKVGTSDITNSVAAPPDPDREVDRKTELDPVSPNVGSHNAEENPVPNLTGQLTANSEQSTQQRVSTRLSSTTTHENENQISQLSSENPSEFNVGSVSATVLMLQGSLITLAAICVLVGGVLCFRHKRTVTNIICTRAPPPGCLRRGKNHLPGGVDPNDARFDDCVCYVAVNAQSQGLLYDPESCTRPCPIKHLLVESDDGYEEEPPPLIAGLNKPDCNSDSCSNCPGTLCHNDLTF